MKKLILISVCCFMVWSSQAQDIDISKDWKFQIGDKPEWAQFATDDSQWNKMSVLGNIEDNGFPDFKGFAWFRKKIVIPSSMKANADKYGYINLVLGGIDDSDQGFFNGKMVGESGKLPPDNYVQGFYNFRIYKINPKTVLWDKENIIAVRLYDDLGQGGFYKGPYLFSVPNGDIYKIIQKPVANMAIPANKQAWTKKIRIPSSLKAQAEKINGLKLETNLPDNVSFFLNDLYVDESNEPKNHSIFVPFKAIRWDADNYLTVYIEKSAPNDEVLFSKLNFLNANLIDVITVKRNTSVKPFDFALEVANLSNTQFKGTIILELVSDIYKKEAFSTQTILVEKNAKSLVNFSFQPTFSGVYSVNYRMIDVDGNVLMGKISTGVLP